MSEYLFTSESVSEGHPDKVADQISDAILDAIFAQDPKSRVAAETLVATDLCVLAGEITTTAQVDYEQIARDTIARIGYTDSSLGFSASTCKFLVNYGVQSPDIAQGVNEGEGIDLNQGAGDQGLMFGYACDETPTLMPFAIYYSHRLMQRQSEVRKSGLLPWLRPDAKAQLTVAYDNETGKVTRIDTVVLSTQRLRLNRAQNHRGYLWRRSTARRWRILGQRPEQSGPLRRLCRALCGEKHCCRRLGKPMPNPNFLRHRRGGTHFYFGGHLWHGQTERSRVDQIGARTF